MRAFPAKVRAQVQILTAPESSTQRAGMQKLLRQGCLQNGKQQCNLQPGQFYNEKISREISQANVDL